MKIAYDLKPCKYCKSINQTIRETESKHRVVCECGLSTASFYDVDLAVKAWNKREVKYI